VGTKLGLGRGAKQRQRVCSAGLRCAAAAKEGQCHGLPVRIQVLDSGELLEEEGRNRGR
jgi:hypothetical protein